MTIKEIEDNFSISSDIDDDQVTQMLNNESLRKEAIEYFITNPNREFARTLLDKIISKRKIADTKIGAEENIMYACYLLGLNEKIEDSLLIWKAKNIDFDTYCGIDVQLMVFAGVDKTLNYLNLLNTEESLKAVSYLKECNEAGDFDNIEKYYSREHLPWWI
ncbi:hypothetical protein [Sporocytophaga myxococcoides]|uniref:hypothetical protein n=1 Tax=Sporocytophaga myxococcoides TaxID=153721 RepID=UPI00040AAEAD|nr:hypothetical protein [Sporocytophaga myxococcoides]